MNERIFKLALEAMDFQGAIDTDTELKLSNDELEKFAELIVQECLKIVEPDQTSGDEWCVTLDETAQSIRQHFGLELRNDTKRIRA